MQNHYIYIKKRSIMHLEKLGNLLKSRREVLNITQRDLAELSNVGLRTLKALENGETNPTLNTLNKILEVLGMEFSIAVRKPKL